MRELSCRSKLWAVALLALAGCDSGAVLTVFVRTDLAPRTEFDRVRLTVAGGAHEHRVRPSDDWFDGINVAEISGLPSGGHTAHAELLDGERLVAEQRVSFALRGPYALSILVPRSCSSVRCDVGRTCVRGLCVDERCALPDPPLDVCPAPDCATDEACPAPTQPCSVVHCVERTCLQEPDHARCEDPVRTFCDVVLGCIPPWTGPPEDAGIDAGPAPDGGPACTPAGCDDFVDCTADDCNGSACRHTPNASLCTAAPGGTCDPTLGCQYPTCTLATCADDPGSCLSARCEGTTCVRTPACTGGATCCAGACVAPGCDDGNPCTDDTCGASGCNHGANSAGCNDGNACTSGDRCSGGGCGGSAVGCNDGNDCTDDSCNPSSGCVFSPRSAGCDDGNACTSGDACSGGSCRSGSPIGCDDGNGCTDDSCNPASGCVFSPNAASCTDGAGCASTCSGGACPTRSCGLGSCPGDTNIEVPCSGGGCRTCLCGQTGSWTSCGSCRACF